MTIDKALKIEGFMSAKELKWLAEEAEKRSVIVEIGSYLGRSTRALGDNTPGKVFAVDYWREPFEYATFYENLKDLIESGRAVPVRADSKTIELNVAPDMVFIDGNHEYEVVKLDIAKWKHAKFLCGHDFTHPGVRTALEELDKTVTVVEGTDIWYV